MDHFSREFLPCTRAPIARHHAAGKQDDLTLHLISRNPISHPRRGTCAAAAAAAPAALDLAGPISTLCAAAAAIMAKLMELGGEVTRSEE